LSGIVHVIVAGELTAVGDAFIRSLSDGGYTVRKVTLPADEFFGTFSALEATDARAHRRINVVLRNEPWSESARIFETPEKMPFSESA
jgi:hypothetical protein